MGSCVHKSEKCSLQGKLAKESPFQLGESENLDETASGFVPFWDLAVHEKGQARVGKKGSTLDLVIVSSVLGRFICATKYLYNCNCTRPCHPRGRFGCPKSNR